MRDLKFKYIVKKPSGHIFSRIFPLRDIERGYYATWIKNNSVGITSEITKCQYTGLKDKNGKEIFEGDSVLHDSYYIGDTNCPSGSGVVQFDNGSFSIKGNLFPPDLCEEEISNYNIEIIGNIHENPELLESTK